MFRRLAAYCAIMMALSFPEPSFASDPLRLNDSFRLLELTPYMRDVESGGHVFAVQNGGAEELSLILHHLPQNDLAIALNLRPTAPPLLRLFSSDDREFSGHAGASERLQFTVPAGQVQSFFLPPLDAADSSPQLYLWTPDALSAYESSRQTFHSTLLLLLAILFLLAIGVAVMRRSRRAAYALVMAGGLMVLLSSLWMRDVLPGGESFEFLLVNRLDTIRIALAVGALMSVFAHLNLAVKQIINRNYWTRVIIFSDAALMAFAIFWIWQIYVPDFFGLMSVELSHIALAMTCTTALLGAVFVPDRRR